MSRHSAERRTATVGPASACRPLRSATRSATRRRLEPQVPDEAGPVTDGDASIFQNCCKIEANGYRI